MLTNDPAAFGQVYDEFYPKIFGYVFRRIGDYDVARDVSAETFLKAFLNLKSYRNEGHSISSWLYKIATNEMNLYFRKLKYSPELFSRIADGLLADQVLHQVFEREKSETERQMRDYEDFSEIQRHLKSLDVKYQEVIALKYFEEKSIEEISQILDKPEGTIKSLLSRGIDKLRKRLT